MQEWQEAVNSSKLLSRMNSTYLTAWQVTVKIKSLAIPSACSMSHGAE